MSTVFFFFNDTATTEIYTLSLHDALPIWPGWLRRRARQCAGGLQVSLRCRRSEEHTSELQSPCNLVCRLLLEKKNVLLCLTSTASEYHNRPLGIAFSVVYVSLKYLPSQHA